jgi:hypothetical protein
VTQLGSLDTRSGGLKPGVDAADEAYWRSTGGSVEALLGLGALFSLFFFLAFLVLTVGGFALWVWAFLDVIKKDDWMFAAGTKVIWAIVVGLGGPLGAVIYMAVGRVRPARV